MNIHNYLKKVREYFDNIPKETLELALDNVHHKGLFSLVVQGTEFGKLTRIFIAKNKIKPFSVQFHTHRYPIRLTVLQGELTQYTAKEVYTVGNKTVQLSKLKYKSPLNGGAGLEYKEDVIVDIEEFKVPIGSSIEMTTNEFHTVSCSKNTIWIVEEQGFEVDHSWVLGVPFILDNLYTKPTSFSVNDNFQLCRKALDNLILQYKTIGK